MALKISYIPGISLDKSYFVGREGSKKRVVRASNIIPAEVQQKVLAGDKDVLEPEQIAKQMTEESGNTLAGFIEFIKKNAKITKSAADMQGWAINEAEVEHPDLPAKGDRPLAAVTRAVSEQEVKDTYENETRSDGKPVKQYFQRLPNTTVGEGHWARSVQSSDKVVEKKAEDPQVMQLKAELEKTIAEVEALKKQTKQKEVSAQVSEIIEQMKEGGMIKDEEELNKMTQQLSGLDTAGLSAMAALVGKMKVSDVPPHLKASASVNETVDNDSGNAVQLYESEVHAGGSSIDQLISTMSAIDKAKEQSANAVLSN